MMDLPTATFFRHRNVMTLFTAWIVANSQGAGSSVTYRSIHTYHVLRTETLVIKQGFLVYLDRYDEDE